MMTQEQEAEFQNEISLMMALRPHSNVVALYGVTSNPTMVIMEFAEGGSLHSVVRSGRDANDNDHHS